MKNSSNCKDKRSCEDVEAQEQPLLQDGDQVSQDLGLQKGEGDLKGTDLKTQKMIIYGELCDEIW